MNKENTSLRKRHDATSVELKQYKLLVDSVKDYAIFMLDADGYIKTWNKGAEKNKGYAAEEIIGKHFSTFYMDEDKRADKPAKELEIAKKYGRAEDEDWRVRKDGSKFWASVVITALYENDELVGFAKVTRDLTDRKIHEDELRKANALLKAQQQELQRLNKSKDDFISLASHQLRTPATAIKQLLGLYIDGLYVGLDDQHMKIIKKAYQSNDRQIRIVNSLLKVAQVDAGKVILNISKCDVRQLVVKVIDDLDDTCKKRKQTIKYSNTAEVTLIDADEHNLRMALENLLSNASKYTHPNGEIKVSLTNADNRELVISIEDNGVGVAKKDMKNLFEKFSRIPNPLSDEVGGSGLGLYWVRKIVELHGGRIEVSSEVNVGSIFKVILPLGITNA